MKFLFLSFAIFDCKRFLFLLFMLLQSFIAASSVFFRFCFASLSLCFLRSSFASHRLRFSEAEASPMRRLRRSERRSGEAEKRRSGLAKPKSGGIGIGSAEAEAKKRFGKAEKRRSGLVRQSRIAEKWRCSRYFAKLPQSGWKHQSFRSFASLPFFAFLPFLS
jgi:hypothetical protein